MERQSVIGVTKRQPESQVFVNIRQPYSSMLPIGLVVLFLGRMVLVETERRHGRLYRRAEFDRGDDGSSVRPGRGGQLRVESQTSTTTS
jgi:hypothetical protein